MAMVIAIISGLLMVAGFFIQTPLLVTAIDTLANWVVMVAAIALILGVGNLVWVHGRRLIHQEAGWIHSFALLAALTMTIVLGLMPGMGGSQSPGMVWIVAFVYQPLAATILSLLGFSMASAAIRTLRAHTPEGAVLLAAALVVLLGSMPWIAPVWDGFSRAQSWLLSVVGAAGMRGILIATALGALAAGGRVLMGLDRHYLDRG
jgi:hypothetical protein